MEVVQTQMQPGARQLELSIGYQAFSERLHFLGIDFIFWSATLFVPDKNFAPAGTLLFHGH